MFVEVGGFETLEEDLSLALEVEVVSESLGLAILVEQKYWILKWDGMERQGGVDDAKKLQSGTMVVKRK